MVQMGVVQERFGRDTADVEAGTSETTTLLDTDGLGEKSSLATYPGWAATDRRIRRITRLAHLETFLTSLDSSNVSSDTTTDDHDIVFT